ncbi:MAG: hypothetical protein ACK4TA_13805 [Saprospiraceae bacterium]
MSVSPSTKLTALQLELLKIYSFEPSEEELLQLKELLGQFFAERLQKMADDAWEKNGWTAETMEAWLNDEHQ